MEVIIGLGVGAAVLYLWGWQRAKYVRWFFQRRKRAEAFERGMREARESLAGACPYRKPTPADRELVALLPELRELVACGFEPIGELVLQPPGKPAKLAVGCYLDAAHTTYAMTWTAGAVRLGSYAADKIFATGQRPHVVLAEPPFIDRALLGEKLSIADLVAGHRKRVGDHALARIADLDDLLARLIENHDRAVAWRAAQAPEELLDADLKCVLGGAYARYGKAWARRLRGKLPEARLMS
ncbi:MAG: hypothetical protein ACM31C_28995 [Acidobacteriota bacterium]